MAWFNEAVVDEVRLWDGGPAQRERRV